VTAARPPLALTLGEPAGIGPDIALAAWDARRRAGLPAFVHVGAGAILKERARRLGLDVPVVTVESAAQAAEVFDRALPCLAGEEEGRAEPGRPDAATAPLVVSSVRRAVELVASGEAAAVVTNPIAKQTLIESGFGFPGHTEYLGALARELFGVAARPVMMLAAPMLRTVPVTIHVPLAEVPRLLTRDLIVETGRVVAADLARRFGILEPRLAVSGLNPHAGEGGLLGVEERETIAPAIAALRRQGIDAFGPLPADTMFHEAARARYDAALMMYHDQALIPLKALAFDEGVNLTLGLPFVRASPDHGTAFDIAGTGRASPTSLIAALRLAARLAAGG